MSCAAYTDNIDNTNFMSCVDRMIPSNDPGRGSLMPPAILSLLLATCSVLDPAQPALPEAEAVDPDGSLTWAPEIVPPGERLSFQVDYLYWFLRQLRVPALLTEGPAGGTGVVGDPGTTVLRGDDRLPSRHDRYVGVRLQADYWLDPEETIGLEARGFFLERDSSKYTVRYDAVPLLALPYVDQNGAQRAMVVAGQTGDGQDLTGGSTVYSRIELFGEEGNMMVNLARDEQGQVNLVLGSRFLQMRERLDQTSTYRILPAKTTLVGIDDHFQTFDKFFGIQTGVDGVWRLGRWSLEGRAEVALGATDQEIRNKGDRIYQTPFERLTSPYGLRVLPSNTGDFQRGAFDWATEVGGQVGYDLTQRVRLHLGYSFLTWANPVRPGDQVGPLNLSQVDPAGTRGPLQPLVRFKEDFFWAHGANAGIELRW